MPRRLVERENDPVKTTILTNNYPMQGGGCQENRRKILVEKRLGGAEPARQRRAEKRTRYCVGVFTKCSYSCHDFAVIVRYDEAVPKIN